MTPRGSALLATGVCVAACVATPALAVQHEPPQGFMRGMTVSAPRGGQVWGTEAMDAALIELSALGVGWVALHPYARLDRTGEVTFTPPDQAAYLERAVHYARNRRMALYWVPHLAVWRTFPWRGAIAFDSEDAWRRFFDGYTAFIVAQARFAEAAGVPVLAVGLEYEGTVHRERDWREVIRRVREVYSGRLTYAANWDGIHDVPFWDALDLIGVQGYFPLSDSGEVTRAELTRSWERILGDLRGLSERVGVPVVFNEVGYARSRTVASEPWADDPDHSPAVRATRALLMNSAMDALERTDFVVGMFWWKWIPGTVDRARNFSMRDPEAVETLRRRWGGR